MVHPLIIPRAQAERDARGHGLVIPIRRDTPETGINTSPTNLAPNAAADTLGAITQIHSAAQFGYVPRILAGLSMAVFCGPATMIGTATTGDGRIGRVVLYEGAAGLEIAFAEARIDGWALAQTNTTDAAATAVVAAVPLIMWPLMPRLMGPETRLAGAAEESDAKANRNIGVWPNYYDAEQWSALPLAIDPVSFWMGQFYGVGSELSAIAALTQGGPGAYVTVPVNGSNTLDADYLVTGGVIHAPTGLLVGIGSLRCEVAIGEAGNEVIQSVILGAHGGIFQSGTFNYRFPTPFIAYAGETLRSRINAAAGGNVFRHALHLWRIT